jgi:hypothetical protein
VVVGCRGASGGHGGGGNDSLVVVVVAAAAAVVGGGGGLVAVVAVVGVDGRLVVAVVGSDSGVSTCGLVSFGMEGCLLVPRWWCLSWVAAAPLN